MNLNKIYVDNVFEGYLDSEQKYYDYGTESISGNDVIDVHRTGMSFYDQFIKNNKEDIEYLKNNKNLVGNIVMMSPSEYYEACATKIFNSSVESLKQQREADKETIKHLKNVIQLYKKKLCMPMLNYADEGQEGLHRMFVVGELYGWNHKVPVLVVDWYDKERANKEATEKKKYEIDKRVEKATDELLHYNYRDKEELKQQLQWELDRQFEFSDEYETPVDFDLKETSDSFIIVFSGYEYPVDKKSINFKNIEDELDDIDWDDEETISWLNKNIPDWNK